MRIVWAAVAACGIAVIAWNIAVGDEKQFVGPPAPIPEFKVLCTITTDEKAPRDDPYGPGDIAFSPYGHALAVADARHYKFWEPRTGKELTFDNADGWKPSEFALNIAFLNRQTVATYAAADTHVHILAFPSGKEIARLDLEKKPLAHFAVAPGVVAVGESGSGVHVWAGTKWEQSWRIEVPKVDKQDDASQRMVLSPDGTELVVSTRYSNILVYRVADGKLLVQTGWQQHGVGQPHIAFHPNGRELALASGGRVRGIYYESLSVWDTRLKTRRFQAKWGEDDPKAGTPGGCYYTPDGKTILIPCSDKTLRLYESETGHLRHVGKLPNAWDAYGFTPSPDGRLVVVGARHRATVIDWRAPSEVIDPPDSGRLEMLWTDLASPNAARAFRAVVELGTVPTRAARLIEDKLKPIPNADNQTVKGWIADLGADDFATREKAEQELAKLGNAAESALREAVKSDNAERGTRASRLLKAVERKGTPERLRILRAIEVLEYADNPTGRDVLKELAGGDPSALLTREAKASLARLEAMDSKPESNR